MQQFNLSRSFVSDNLESPMIDTMQNLHLINEHLTDEEFSQFNKERDEALSDIVALNALYNKWNKKIIAKRLYEKNTFHIECMKTSYEFGQLPLKTFIDKCLMYGLFKDDYMGLLRELSSKITIDEYDKDRFKKGIQRELDSLEKY